MNQFTSHQLLRLRLHRVCGWSFISRQLYLTICMKVSFGTQKWGMKSVEMVAKENNKAFGATSGTQEIVSEHKISDSIAVGREARRPISNRRAEREKANQLNKVVVAQPEINLIDEQAPAIVSTAHELLFDPLRKVKYQQHLNQFVMCLFGRLAQVRQAKAFRWSQMWHKIPGPPSKFLQRLRSMTSPRS